MKTCPKCKELNGENRTDCWNCHASLGVSSTYRKICPKCGLVYSSKTELCDKCGSRLSVCSNTSVNTASSENDGCWMYIASIIVPLLGIILGCIYIAKDENELGKSLIITGIVSNILAVLLGIFLASCS